MLGELEGDGRWVVGDMEAGLGTLLRCPPGTVDAVLVVAQPFPNALDIAGRAARIAANRDARVIVVANRVTGADDLAAVRAAVGDVEIVAVPDDPAVAQSDATGESPLDAAPDAPAVQAVVALAHRLAGSTSVAG